MCGYWCFIQNDATSDESVETPEQETTNTEEKGEETQEQETLELPPADTEEYPSTTDGRLNHWKHVYSDVQGR